MASPAAHDLAHDIELLRALASSQPHCCGKTHLADRFGDVLPQWAKPSLFFRAISARATRGSKLNWPLSGRLYEATAAWPCGRLCSIQQKVHVFGCATAQPGPAWP